MKMKKTPYLKLRKDIRCTCKRQKSNEKDRIKFGVCRCDGYSMYYTLGHVIANYLYQYLNDAKGYIIREDYDDIEKHAKAIREFADADNWDEISKNVEERKKYRIKVINWKKANKWLEKNWNTLWW
jgi:hypothetical protein